MDIEGKNRITGRFAPSPSGRMHVGNLLSALLAWLSARAAGGRMVLRMEDLDPDRTSRALADHEVELIVLAGFMSILSEDFTSRWPRRILNVHPSLIPSFCGKGYYGLKVHEAALAYGVKVTGATVHFVNEVPDGGEILLQKAVEVLPGDTPEVLQRRVMEQAEWILLPQATQMISEEIRREKDQ